MEFEEAMKYLKQGDRIVNNNWNSLKMGKIMYIRAQFPDKDSMNTEPYIVFVSDDKRVFPWTPSSLDLWSKEWEVK